MVDGNELIQVVQDALLTQKSEFEKFFLVKLFGLRFAYPDQTCVVEFDVRDWMHNPRGTLHGGVISLVMDVSMGHLLNHAVGPAATIETKIQFIAPVREGTVRAVGSFMRKGRSIQYMESRLLDGTSALLAHATSTWKLVGGEPSR